MSWKEMRKPTKNLSVASIGIHIWTWDIQIVWQNTDFLDMLIIVQLIKKGSFFPFLFNTEVDYLVHNMPSLAACG
jgi:hypothetical protein